MERKYVYGASYRTSDRIEGIDDQYGLLNEAKNQVEGLEHDIVNTAANIMAMEDMFNENSVRLIPAAKKIGSRIHNIIALAFKKGEMKLDREELRDKKMDELVKANEKVASAIQNQNEALNRIARALEKK